MERSWKRTTGSLSASCKIPSVLVFKYNQHLDTATSYHRETYLFDLDDTLITPKSYYRYSRNPKDWKFKYDNVQSELRSLTKKNKRIFIITNQLGIGKGYVHTSDFEEKMNSVASLLGVPFTLLASTAEDENRKPFTGLWDYIQTRCSNGQLLDPRYCKYIGDAAGRPNDIARSRMADHSNCDLLFAENLKLEFETPEMFFEGLSKDYENSHLALGREGFLLSSTDFISEYFTKCVDILLAVSSGNVLKNISNARNSPALRNNGRKLSSNKLDGTGAGKMIILVNGPPCSGKSHFISKFLNDKAYYSWVS